MILIVMGVSGTGKSLIGEMLAERLGCSMIDGDTLHSAENRHKMSLGIPLTDEDRWPWLNAIRSEIETKQRLGGVTVFTCSSLKRVYRDILRGKDQDVSFVYLKGSYELLQQRLGGRAGHFFNPTLLRSQLDTLEEPDASEAIEVNVELSPEQIVEQVLQQVFVLQVND